MHQWMWLNNKWASNGVADELQIRFVYLLWYTIDGMIACETCLSWSDCASDWSPNFVVNLFHLWTLPHFDRTRGCTRPNNAVATIMIRQSDTILRFEVVSRFFSESLSISVWVKCWEISWSGYACFFGEYSRQKLHLTNSRLSLDWHLFSLHSSATRWTL